MTSPEDESAAANRWAVRARTTPSVADTPPASDVLDEELTRIERRIDDVITLRVVTLEERRGIITTRNIAAQSGCGAMNTEIFWRTVTERLPEVIARIRATDRN